MKKILYGMCCTLGILSVSVSAQEEQEVDAFELSLKELLDVEVTSVARQAQPLSNSPAAVYVISSEEIQRRGLTSIPQALKGVPGLHVAQIDSQKWAVSSRGFNGRFNNKLLVLMDGRTLYSPVFSGVYWEVQDTLMADIERIEVIRGPNAAMWGSNAVNGVINIVTKHSAETLGGYAEIGIGDYNQGFAGFRYGGKLTDNTTARGYAKTFKRDSLEHEAKDINPDLALASTTNLDTDNDWTEQQVGGRVDIDLPHSATLQLSSDLYKTRMNQVLYLPTLAAPYASTSQDNVDSKGWNLLAKFNQALSARSEYSVQGYVDYVSRDEGFFTSETKTFDLEFQHQFQFRERHNIRWGLGFRHNRETIGSHPNIFSDSNQTSTNLWSAFVSDEITLAKDALWLTLATRVEDNTYTGFEWQPNARLLWKLNEQHKLWSSVSYSVRTPSRTENNVNFVANVIPPFVAPNVSPLPVVVRYKGQDEYESESLLTYELGYRFSPTSSFSIDSTVFYNDYDDLRDADQVTTDFVSLPGYIIQDVEFGNSLAGHSYGLEFSSQWLATDTVKFKLNYGYIQSKFPGVQPQNTTAPKHIATFDIDWAVHQNVDVNATWRYVDDVAPISGHTQTYNPVDSYHGVDLGVNWRITPKVTLSAYGKNLFYGAHTEFESELFSIPYRIEPTYYGKVTVQF